MASSPGAASTKDLLCIGHRGAMGHSPENTLPSFARALALGAPCIELDVRVSEGRLLVFHDERLERTTNGQGRFDEASFERLRSLDAGHGAGIPTLDEVMALVDRRAGVNIELKGPATAAPVLASLERLHRSGWPDDLLLVSSFDVAQLRSVRAANASVRIGLLCKRWQPDTLAIAGELRAGSVHLSIEAATTPAIDEVQAAGLRAYVYTVNDPVDIARFRDAGVDGVFSNFPERVLAGNCSRVAAGWA